MTVTKVQRSSRPQYSLVSATTTAAPFCSRPASSKASISPIWEVTVLTAVPFWILVIPSIGKPLDGCYRAVRNNSCIVKTTTDNTGRALPPGVICLRTGPAFNPQGLIFTGSRSRDVNVRPIKCHPTQSGVITPNIYLPIIVDFPLT